MSGLLDTERERHEAAVLLPLCRALLDAERANDRAGFDDIRDELLRVAARLAAERDREP